MTSKRDQARYDALREAGCIACLIGGYLSPCGYPEIHHLVDFGYRKHSGGNKSTICLGAWHHRGEPRQGFTVKQMRDLWGPSMKLESKTFALTYGTQRELLAKFDRMISYTQRETA